MDLLKEKQTEIDRFIRQPEVTFLTSIPKSSIPEAIEKMNFPKNAKIMARSRVWSLKEVQQWMNERLAERYEENEMQEEPNAYDNKEIIKEGRKDESYL